MTTLETKLGRMLMTTLETVTVYKDCYYNEMDRAFKLSTELAELRGTVRALAEMEDHPEFVFNTLKELVNKMETA